MHFLKYIFIFVITTIFLSGTHQYLNAQDSKDSVIYDFGFLFDDGIYLEFKNFRNNSPLEFSRLVLPSYDDADFFAKLDTASEIIFNDDYGISVIRKKQQVWGYCKKGKPYVFYNGKANLIPYIGSISHFVSTVKVLYNTTYDPFYDPFYSPYYFPYNSTRTVQSEELRYFIIDMETGQILEYNVNNLENIFKREPKIYEEFSKLSKRKKMKQLFYYVRLYNELKPLKLPLNNK